MTTDDDSRRQGVEFGSLDDELESLDYPVTTEELLEDYGDHELELEDDAQTLRSLLEPQGEVTFESAEGVKESVVGMVGDEAIGRKNYSDRGDTPDPKEGSDEESV